VDAGKQLARRGLRSTGVPDPLVCRQDITAHVVAAMLYWHPRRRNWCPYVHGLRYLDPPPMIYIGLLPRHPGAVRAYHRLHGRA
jgi:hypothetical protein